MCILIITLTTNRLSLTRLISKKKILKIFRDSLYYYLSYHRIARIFSSNLTAMFSYYFKDAVTKPYKSHTHRYIVFGLILFKSWYSINKKCPERKNETRATTHLKSQSLFQDEPYYLKLTLVVDKILYFPLKK